MKNKLTVTRGEREVGNRGKKGKGHQGICMNDPYTKSTRRSECGRWVWVGQGRVMGRKWRQ